VKGPALRNLVPFSAAVHHGGGFAFSIRVVFGKNNILPGVSADNRSFNLRAAASTMPPY
jgi:hypothetical protein